METAPGSAPLPALEDFMTGFDIFAIAFVLLVIVTLFAGIKTVPQGWDWTIERFGKYTRTLSPGLNIIVPYFDRVGRKMNMMEQVISIPEQEVITRDNATVTVDGVAFFQVFDAPKASYEVANLNQAIIVLTMTNIRSVMGAMDLDQVLSHRDEINERLLRVVDAAARERLAEAEAKATQMVSEAIANGDVAALNYFIADKYIKAFGQFADSPNQKILMLPVEAMSILSSLAGIGEIARATFGESAASATAAARRGSVPSAGPTPPPAAPQR